MRVRSRTVLFVLAGALAGGCASRPVSSASDFDRAQATRDVYVASLREAGKGANPTRYVVDPVAAPCRDWDLHRLPTLRPDTRADFLAAKRAARVPADLDPGSPVAWFSEAEWNSLPDGWDGFWKRFPGAPGMTEFSRVGFSRDGTQAIVYVQHSSGGLSGWGALFLLERHADGWRVVQRETVLTA